MLNQKSLKVHNICNRMIQARLQPINHDVMMCPLLFFLLFFLFLFRSYHHFFLTHSVSSELKKCTLCVLHKMSRHLSNGAMYAVEIIVDIRTWKLNNSMNQENASECNST